MPGQATPGSLILKVALGLGLSLALAGQASAALYKCTVAGKTVYQDRECPGVKDSKPYTPKNPINTVSSQSITGQAPKEVDKRPPWLRPIDPVAECKSKGGKIDPELRACMVP